MSCEHFTVFSRQKASTLGNGVSDQNGKSKMLCIPALISKLSRLDFILDVFLVGSHNEKSIINGSKSNIAYNQKKRVFFNVQQTIPFTLTNFHST